MVDISGRIVLASAALRGLIHDLLIGENRKILFNLGKVDYIDSSRLGHLIGASTSVRKGGGELMKLLKSWMTRGWRFGRLTSQLLSR
jgi:anti-anti-sigma factor